QHAQPNPFVTLTSARARIGDNPDLLLIEAQLRFRHGEAEQARDLLSLASRVAPKRADIAAFAGIVLTDRKCFAEAEEAFCRAIQCDPQSVLARHQFGFSLLQAGECQGALQQFEAALGIDRFNQATLAGYGLALRALGDGRYASVADYDRFVRAYEIVMPEGVAAHLRELHSAKVESLVQTLRVGTETSV